MYKILAVDDSKANLSIIKNSLQDTYNVVPVISGVKALQIMEKTVPDLILLDIDMPDMNGFEVVSRLKTSPKFKDIPVIFLTGQSDQDDELEGLNLGAVDYIRKPFCTPLLKKRVSIHLQAIAQKRQAQLYAEQLRKYNQNLEGMVVDKTKDIVNLERAIISIVTDLLEGKDGYTGGHVIRVSKYMRAFLNALSKRGMLGEIKTADIDMIALFSQLHDVGKVRVAEQILLKPSSLNVIEATQMRMHTIYGADSIQKSMRDAVGNAYLDHAMQMARGHHEWWDGTGYPSGLSGANIPLIARVLAVCDAYDEIKASRSYKAERTHKEVVQIIANSSGTQFDPKLAEAFVQEFGEQIG